MKEPYLFMLLLGASLKDRHLEQHDVFFGIGTSLRELVPDIIAFWPEAGTLHIDAWRAVTTVNGYEVQVVKRNGLFEDRNNTQLFFLNLGGYIPNEFEEFHYRMLVAAPDKAAAIQKARQTAFYKHMGFKGASSHIDDKFGVDVDDVHQIMNILPHGMRDQYRIRLLPVETDREDEVNLGYFRLNKL